MPVIYKYDNCKTNSNMFPRHSSSSSFHPFEPIFEVIYLDDGKLSPECVTFHLSQLTAESVTAEACYRRL